MNLENESKTMSSLYSSRGVYARLIAAKSGSGRGNMFPADSYSSNLSASSFIYAFSGKV